MGNPNRCPSCNRFGASELNGYCKDCYKEPTKPYVKPGKLQNIRMEYKNNPKLVNSALLEIGKNIDDNLTEDEANRVYNIIKRRKPVNRYGHVVKDISPMEEYGYNFKEEKKEYGIIKEVCNYERLE